MIFILFFWVKHEMFMIPIYDISIIIYQMNLSLTSRPLSEESFPLANDHRFADELSRYSFASSVLHISSSCLE